MWCVVPGRYPHHQPAHFGATPAPPRTPPTGHADAGDDATTATTTTTATTAPGPAVCARAGAGAADVYHGVTNGHGGGGAALSGRAQIKARLREQYLARYQAAHSGGGGGGGGGEEGEPP